MECAACTISPHRVSRSAPPRNSRGVSVEPDFGEGWHPRAEAAAEWLSEAVSVADLGCGTMSLERYLRREQHYVPVDLASRDERTLVLDFNRTGDLARLPDADAAALLGVLEYSYAPDPLLDALHSRYGQVVVSFNVLRRDEGLEARTANGWVNHFTREELLEYFGRHGFMPKRERLFDGKRQERVFDLRRSPR